MSGITFDHSSLEYRVFHFNFCQESRFATEDAALQHYKTLTGGDYKGSYAIPFGRELFVTTSKSYNTYNKKRIRKTFFEKMNLKKKKQGRKKKDVAKEVEEEEDEEHMVEGVYVEEMLEDCEDEDDGLGNGCEEEEEDDEVNGGVENLKLKNSFGSLFSSSSDSEGEQNVDILPKNGKRKMDRKKKIISDINNKKQTNKK